MSNVNINALDFILIEGGILDCF